MCQSWDWLKENLLKPKSDKHIVLSAKHRKEVKDFELEFQQETIERLKMFFAYGLPEIK